MNRTRKYLSPILKSYGKEFADKVHSVFKLAYGLGDIVVVNSNIKLEKHIFILIDTNIGRVNFENFMQWIKTQPMYQDDYAYDELDKGHLHMLVIKFPEQYIRMLETFKKGKYSKLYTKEEIEEYITREDAKQVLIQDHNYKLEFIEEVNTTFGTDIKAETCNDDFELDFPPKQKEETFIPTV